MNDVLISCDDLFSPTQVELYLQPLKDEVPDLVVTCYTIPNRFGPVHDAKKRWPWIVFAAHGAEHTRGECLSWDDELAKAKLEWCLEMGFAPIFKAPGYAQNDDLEIACHHLGFILHHDRSYTPMYPGTKVYPGHRQRTDHDYIHCHLQQYRGSQDFIVDNPRMHPDYLRRYDSFLTPLDLAVVV
jgi:hypothetical protein